MDTSSNNKELIKNYRDKWSNFVKTNYFPTVVRDVKKIEYDEFKKNVFHDAKKTELIINDLLEGDVIVLRGAVNKTEALNLKKRVSQWGKQTPEENHEEYTPIPNFHTKSSQERIQGKKSKDGYDEIAESYFFYRWNKDDLQIFSTIDDVWSVIKALNGIPDSLKTNLPEDLLIDRIQLLRYPVNSGEITLHCDYPGIQATNAALTLSKRGEDYESGGFDSLHKNGEIDIEELAEVGDVTIWLGSIFHGVKVPKDKIRGLENDLSGRWQLTFTAIQSRLVDERKRSYSFKEFENNKEKILKEYTTLMI